MKFELPELAIVTIGPLEPALIVSLFLASIAAWLLGKRLGRLTALVEDPWRRRLYAGPIWVLAGGVFFILPNLIVCVVFPVLHPAYAKAIVCVAMVWPTFVLPVCFGFLGAVRALHGGARRTV